MTGAEEVELASVDDWVLVQSKRLRIPASRCQTRVKSFSIIVQQLTIRIQLMPAHCAISSESDVND